MVTIKEVIESAGYDLTTIEDNQWLLSRRNEIERLLEAAEELIEDVAGLK